MYYLYKITNSESGTVYIGMTNNIKKRWRSHKYAHRFKKTPLYDAMRSYGFDKFFIEELLCNTDKATVAELEVMMISFNKTHSIKSYNLHEGGTGGYSMSNDPRYEEWKAKLKAKRVGRKPALGMKHSEKNKEYFKFVSNEYWNTQDTYNPKEILSLSFLKAKELFGISKTHYYRLRKRAKINELS